MYGYRYISFSFQVYRTKLSYRTYIVPALSFFLIVLSLSLSIYIYIYISKVGDQKALFLIATIRRCREG